MRPPLKRTLIGISIILLLGLLAMVIGGFALFRGLTGEADSVSVELERARKAGIPASPSQLLSQKAIDPADNAALTLVKLTELWVELGVNVRPEILRAVYDGSASEVDTVETLESFAGVFKLAEKAASQDQCRFYRNWEDGPRMNSPVYHALRNAAALLSRRAERFAHAGQFQAAEKDLLVLMKLADHSMTDPTYDGLAGGTILKEFALNSAALIACQVRSNEAIALARTVASFPLDLNPLLAIRGEASLTLMIGADLKKYEAVLPKEVQSVAGQPGPVADAMNALLIRRYAIYVQALNKHDGDIDALLDEAIRQEATYQPSKKPTEILASIFQPRSSTLIASVAEVQDSQRILLAVCDILDLSKSGPPSDSQIQGLPSIQAIQVQKSNSDIRLTFSRPNRRPVSLNLSAQTDGFQKQN